MIGVFDSGSGGLTVVRAMREVMPSCGVLYFGDIKNAPYGTKSQEELFLLTIQAIKFLTERGSTKIVSACNSVSASLALSLFDMFSLTSADIIEMVGPTVAHFREHAGRIVLCATPATIHSGIYQHGFRMFGKNIEAIAIPELAGAIEFGKPEAEVQAIIRMAFEKVVWAGGDVLILGCTHYPLVRELFRNVVPPTISIFDPAMAIASRVKKQFWPQEMGNGIIRFVISKDSERFRILIAQLFGGDSYTIEVLG